MSQNFLSKPDSGPLPFVRDAAMGVWGIEPSIGRVLWYWPDHIDRDYGYVQIRASQPFAATVAFVRDSCTVNLSIADSLGRHFCRQDVRLVQPGDTEKPEEGYCEWMPYQIAKAKV